MSEENQVPRSPSAMNVENQEHPPQGGSWCLPCFRNARQNDLTARPSCPNNVDNNGASLPPTLAQTEIENRLWINEEGNEKFKVALDTWEAKDKLFGDRIDMKRKQSDSLRNEIYQLVGYYVVFPGVLITAVAQASELNCHTWWSVFSLSLLASIVTIGGVIQKFISVIALEKTIASEAFCRKLCINWKSALLQKGKDFSFEKHTKDPKPRSPKSQF